MKTAVIRVTDAPGGGYAVQFFVDDGSAGWWDRPIANAEIKADRTLDPPELREDGVTPVDAAFCRDLVRNRTGASADFRRAGQYLGRLLFRADVADEWRRRAGADFGPGVPRPQLRTILDIRVDALRDLPWELMSLGPVRTVTDVDRPFARGRVRWDAQPDPIEWPIKVLVVVGAAPEVVGAASKNDELYTELAAVEDSLASMRNLVDFEILRQPTRAQVMAAYTQLEPHIFHFIGHGRVDAGEGVLDLHDTTGGSQVWRAGDIVATLGPKPPRLAILNACRSAGGADDPAPFLVTSAFEQAGAWAVLGMQGDILGVAAAVCAGAIYRSFAGGDAIDVALAKGRRFGEGDPIDVALTKGRQAVIAELTSETRDWALPVLTFSVPPDRLLSVKLDVTQAQHMKIANSREFTDVRDSVDRAADRRRLRTNVEAGDIQRRLLIVRGNPEIGKTDLVRWALEGCALRGSQVSYVELDRDGSFDCLEVLRMIKDGDPKSVSVVREPLPRAAFARLNRDLNLLLRDQPVPETPPVGPVSDDNLPLKEGAEYLIATIFQGFRAALVEAARTRPIIIALDRADRVVETHFKSFLLPYLLRPIARGEVEGVRFVIAIREEAWRDYGLNTLSNPHNDVRVGLIDRKEFVHAARRFLRYYNKQGPEFDNIVKSFAEVVEKENSEWSPGRWLVALRAVANAR